MRNQHGERKKKNLQIDNSVQNRCRNRAFFLIVNELLYNRQGRDRRERNLAVEIGSDTRRDTLCRRHCITMP